MARGAKHGNKNAAGSHKKSGAYMLGGFVSGIIHSPKHNEKAMSMYAKKSSAGLKAYKIGATIRKASGANLFLK